MLGYNNIHINHIALRTKHEPLRLFDIIRDMRTRAIVASICREHGLHALRRRTHKKCLEIKEFN